MHPRWADSILGECLKAEVAFHFKQWGEWAPPRFNIAALEGDCAPSNGAPGDWDFIALDYETGLTPKELDPHGGADYSGLELLERVGVKKAGRELDGRIWDEVPA